jgi:hypothetical protein
MLNSKEYREKKTLLLYELRCVDSIHKVEHGLCLLGDMDEFHSGSMQQATPQLA